MKNIELLGINEARRAAFEEGIKLYKRHSSIEFSILFVKNNTITVRVTQSKCFSEMYQTEKRLSEIAKKFILDFVGDGFKVHTRAHEYNPNHPNIVTAEWLDAKIIASKKTLVQIEKETRLSADNLSLYRHGKLPMTNVIKTALYFYFNGLRLEAELAKAKA